MTTTLSKRMRLATLVALTATMAHAQLNPWATLNGVKGITADTVETSRQALPVPGSSRRGDNPVIFLVGSNSMRCGLLGNGSDGQWGWGYYAADYFDPKRMTVENHAMGDTSPRSYYAQYWKSVVEAMRPGDYVFIELGLNDNTTSDPDDIHASYRPNGKLSLVKDSTTVRNAVTKKREKIYTYGEYLRHFAQEARAKGATPVFLTLAPQLEYEEDHPLRIQRYTKNFTPAIKNIATEMGAPLVDLCEISAAKLGKYGKWKAAYHFYRDKIHSSAYGARMNAQSVAEGIKDSDDPQLSPLKKALSDKLSPRRCDTGRSQGKPAIFLCGDHTGKNTDTDPNGAWGWGSQAYTIFDSTKCVFFNRAAEGHSARTFVEEGLWDEVCNSLEPGDVVFIQFGHNDIGAIKDSKERGSLATAKDSSDVFRLESTGEFRVVYSYGWYLHKMVDDAQAKEAFPVILSLTPRNEWHEGENGQRGFIYPVPERVGRKYIERRNETFGVWCRKVALDAETDYIDLHNLVGNALDKMGHKKAAKYFADNESALSRTGAKLVVDCLARGLRIIENPASEWLK